MIFFITHMPKTDWSTSEYNKNWYYLSGHTHENSWTNDETKKVYADNQIGYFKEPKSFKCIDTSLHNNFQDYKDGIYEITREQYILFNNAMNSRIDFNHDFEKLYMIKRDNIYCFLLKSKYNGKLAFLNGGRLKMVEKHDLNYFYDNLVNYFVSVQKLLKSYNDYQQQISTEIKSIGGTGRIHGCIIDIDINRDNHI